jgi:DNA-directed RNA polymerase subunit RPC12/RpoP
VRQDDFIKAANRYNRRAAAIFAIPLVVALVVAIAYAPCQRQIDAYLVTKIRGKPPEILRLLPWSLPCLVAVAGVILLTRRNDNDMGVACPRCAKPMAHFKAVVIASKSCPYCGTKVLDETP